MAKKKGSTPANTAKWFVRRFDVVRLSFAGKSGHYTDTRKDYESWAVEEGATIADLDSQTEILVVLDKGATSSAEKKANKLNQQGAAIVCFSESQWREKFEPSGDEMLELIRAGKAGGERLATLMERCRARYHGTLFDLQDANLKGCDLTGLDFSSVELSGSDLRQATVETLQTGLIENVRLEQAVGDHFRPGAMKNCSCKGAEFSDFFLGFDYHSAGGTVLENCDFSNAKLHDAYFNYSSIRGTLFKKSDLTGSTFDFASIAKSDFSGANLLKVSLKSIKCGSAVVFRRAKFTAANLQRANLKGADCTGADFSGALLTQADFSGAKIEGANFKDAQLVGASFDQTNVTKAKNLNPPTLTTVKVGAACRAIATAFKEAEEMEISATVKTLEGEVDIHFGATYRGQVRTKFTLRRKGQPDLSDENETKSLSTALKKQGEWWGQGELQFETIGVKSSKSPLKGKPLQEAVAAALAEVFNAAVPSQDDAKATRKQQKQNSDDIKAEMLAELRGGGKGIKAFSKRDADELTRKKLNRFRKEDFGGLKLDGLKMLELDFQSSNFSAGSLKRVKLEDANLRQSDFSDADLSSGDFDGAKFHSCNLQRAKLTKANLVWTSFSGANLSEADLAGANLTGADLSGAQLTGASLDKVKWDNAIFDEKTVFPSGFKIPTACEFGGVGHDPRIIAELPEQLDEINDFEAFMERLNATVDQSRLKKAIKMLQADRFQLFSEVTSDSFVGVVKSQTDLSLVYACRLTAAGDFCCCTQNLNACGGLRGALCKHLLVLLVGLTKSNTLSANDAAAWAQQSLPHKPKLDQDGMTEVLLRYKGAEAGEVDWRPVETVPEDFYAF